MLKTESKRLWVFELLKIGSFSFGGAGRMVLFLDFLVVNKKWLSEKTFFRDVTISQLFPGPNIVNLILLVTLQIFKSTFWSLMALFALTLPGAILGILLVSQITGKPWQTLALRGFSLASIGLSIPFLWRMALSTFPNTNLTTKTVLRGLLATSVFLGSLWGIPLSWILLSAIFAAGVLEWIK